MHGYTHWKPAVSKVWLYLLSGAMWSGVGLMLCTLAFGWLKPLDVGLALAYAASGAVLATAIYAFGFSRLAYQNMHRIDRLVGDRICLFAFQKWSSYPLVLVMITLGIYLRLYSPLPKPILGILYIGLGGSLFFSGLLYFWHSTLRAQEGA